jgi:DNA-binding MarR family transcriptional regulator
MLMNSPPQGRYAAGMTSNPSESSASSEVAELDDASLMIDAVFRFERAVSRIGNLRLRPWNLTLSSYTALRILDREPSLTQAQLARRCYVRPQTMTRMVTQLEERGWVARRPHPESERALCLGLTGEGRAALREMGTEVLRISDTLNSVLGPEDITGTDRRLRQAALAVERELREADRGEDR